MMTVKKQLRITLMILFDFACSCSVKPVKHKMSNEFNTLPPGMYLAECLGCGHLTFRRLTHWQIYKSKHVATPDI